MFIQNKPTHWIWLALVAFFTAKTGAAQNGPSAARKINLSGFDKVQLIQINGQVNIQTGKAFAIVLEGDTSLTGTITARVQGAYTLSLSGPKVRWDAPVEQTSVRVTIYLPELSKLEVGANADVQVAYGTGRYLGITNTGNGNITVTGKRVDLLDIENNGNGQVDATALEAVGARIVKRGNGDVNLKTQNPFSVVSFGNGDVVNNGKGKALIEQQWGNGTVRVLNKE